MDSTTREEIRSHIDEIIDFYNSEMGTMFAETNPGIIRAKKGRLVEKIANDLIKIVWIDILKQDEGRLKINNKKINIKIQNKEAYLNRINSDEEKTI